MGPSPWAWRLRLDSKRASSPGTICRMDTVFPESWRRLHSFFLQSFLRVFCRASRVPSGPAETHLGSGLSNKPEGWWSSGRYCQEIWGPLALGGPGGSDLPWEELMALRVLLSPTPFLALDCTLRAPVK
jgi:hypothetical protein